MVWQVRRRRSSAGHAKGGVVRLSSSSNLSDVRIRGGGARGRGRVREDGCTARRSGACGKRRERSRSSAQAETSAGSSRTDNKRSRQAVVNTPVSPTPHGTAGDETHAQVEDGLLSEEVDAALKTEVAVSFKADPTCAFPGQAAAEEGTTPVEHDSCAEPDGSCAEPDGTVKTEVGILFPSKLAAAGARAAGVQHRLLPLRWFRSVEGSTHATRS
ncbi:unnamed protein product, partial [Pylaiella littoralis]